MCSTDSLLIRILTGGSFCSESADGGNGAVMAVKVVETVGVGTVCTLDGMVGVAGGVAAGVEVDEEGLLLDILSFFAEGSEEDNARFSCPCFFGFNKSSNSFNSEST